MMHTAEFYINKSEKRQKLAKVVQNCAMRYKVSFRQVEIICDADMNIPGAIAQVQFAYNNIKQNIPNNKSRIEFIQAAKDLLELHQSMNELTADGVPDLVSIELSRRIIDSEIIGSKEIMIHPYTL